MCAPACFVELFTWFTCTIACLPAVGQEFHTEPVKQQGATGSRGNGHKLLPLTAAFKHLPYVLLFPAPISAFFTSLTSLLVNLLKVTLYYWPDFSNRPLNKPVWHSGAIFVMSHDLFLFFTVIA